MLVVGNMLNKILLEKAYNIFGIKSIPKRFVKERIKRKYFKITEAFFTNIIRKILGKVLKSRSEKGIQN